jgi:hypothetical protein
MRMLRCSYVPAAMRMSFTVIYTYLQRTDSIPIDLVRLHSLFHKQKKSRFSSLLFNDALSDGTI